MKFFPVPLVWMVLTLVAPTTMAFSTIAFSTTSTTTANRVFNTKLDSTMEPIAELTVTSGLPSPKIPKRVVVTGLGVVNGCGIGHEEFFQACLDGKSSIDRVQRFDISYMPCQIGSECHQFDAKDWFINPKNIKSNDRYTHFAVAAARQALQDAGLGDTPATLIEPQKIGVMVGTAFGGMETFEQQTLKLASNPQKPKVRRKARQKKKTIPKAKEWSPTERYMLAVWTYGECQAFSFFCFAIPCLGPSYSPFY
jgi:hypothetical protein